MVWDGCNKLFRIVIIFLTLPLFVGCASVISGAGHPVSFETIDAKGGHLKGANCDLRNNKGSWVVVTPGTTSVTGSSDDLIVRCEADGHAVGKATVVSSLKPEIFGNILIGGLVGVAIDHASGSGYSYPQAVKVKMGDSVTIEHPRHAANGANTNAAANKRPYANEANVGGGSQPLALAPASPPPQASGWAAINEIETLPLRSERGRSAYRAFLKAPKPKAFAIGQFGTWGWVSGRRDASDEALRFCASMSTLTCRIYAVDETVVWTADDGKDVANATFIPLQEGGGAQGKGGAITDADALPYVNESGRAKYREFVGQRSPRAFAISESGSWGGSWRREDAPERALQYCQKHSRTPCWLYVVNEDVVWPQGSPEL